MDRLRDMTTDNLTVAYARRLLGAMPAINEDTMPRPKMRVRTAARGRFGPAALLVAAALGLVAGAAGARVLIGAPHPPTTPSTTGQAPVGPLPGNEAPVVASALVGPTANLAEAVVTADAPVASGAAVSAPASRGAPQPAALRSHGAAAGSTGSEASLLLEAVRSLKRERDPARARALAEEVLRRYPQGPQAEEALTVVMEAAEARGDTAGAQRAAKSYLAKYPSGHSAVLARRLAASH